MHRSHVAYCWPKCVISATLFMWIHRKKPLKVCRFQRSSPVGSSSRKVPRPFWSEKPLWGLYKLKLFISTALQWKQTTFLPTVSQVILLLACSHKQSSTRKATVSSLALNQETLMKCYDKGRVNSRLYYELVKSMAVSCVPGGKHISTGELILTQHWISFHQVNGYLVFTYFGRSSSSPFLPFPSQGSFFDIVPIFPIYMVLHGNSDLGEQ